MKSVTLLLLLSLLAGCRDNDVEDINASGRSAAFDFDQIQVVSFETRASNSNWADVKDTAIVSLRTCFVDSQYLEPIVGEDFRIESGLISEIESTNTNGCLSWVEEFNFNYLSDESFIEIKGEITGLDNFKGKRAYALAVNPWSRTGVDLAFSRMDGLVQLDQVQAANSASKHIEATRFNVSVLEKSFGQTETKVKLDISTAPELVRKGLDGNTIKEALTSGEFNVDYFIIARTEDSNNRTIVASESKDLNVRDDGFLQSVVEFTLTTGISPNAVIELGVKISALNANLGVDEGIITLQRLDGAMSGDLIDIPVPFSLIMNNKIDLANDNLTDNFGFVIDQVNIRRGSEGGANLSGTSSHSSVVSIVELRMVDPLVHQEIRDHNFNIDFIDLETNENLYSQRVSTLSGSGVIQFRVNIPFRRYNRRRWKEFLIRINSEQAPYANISKERKVYINPWITTTDFGIDSQIGEPTVSDAANIPEIFIDQFSYRFIGNKPESFKLNKNLDLKYDKRLRIEFRPKLKEDHNYEGGRVSYENIVNGEYKLRLLILAPKDNINYDATRVINLDDFYTLTAGETDVTVRNGLVSGDVDLPLLFTDQLVYATKNLALVELSSNEEDTELKPGYFIGTFTGYRKHDIIRNAQANSMSLSTGNADIAQTLISRIQNIREKLEGIDTNTDVFSDFTRRLRDIRPVRQVFNHESFRMERRRTTVQTYGTESSFKRSKRLRSSTSSIRNMVINPRNTSQNLLNEICGLMFDKNQRTVEMHQYPSAGLGSYNPPVEHETVGMDYKKCTERPFDFIEFTKLDHVNEITEQPRNATVETLSLARSVAYFISRGQNFMQSEGVRESEYFQHGWHVGGGIELSKWGFFGGASYGADGGYRRDLYTMSSDAEILSNQERIINQDGLTMTYDRFDIDFRANVKSCVLIAGKDVEVELPKRYTHHSLLDIFRSNEPPRGIIASPKRYYVCLQDGRNVNKSESWYFVRGDKRSTMADDTLSRNSMLNVIRGQKSFESFRQMQLETDKALIIHENDDSSVLTQYQNYLDNRGANISYKDRIGVGFPGLLE